jgi:hypothetical protein
MTPPGIVDGGAEVSPEPVPLEPEPAPAPLEPLELTPAAPEEAVPDAVTEEVDPVVALPGGGATIEPERYPPAPCSTMREPAGKWVFSQARAVCGRPLRR